MCHFETSSLEATLDIETFVGLGAVKDSLGKSSAWLYLHASNAAYLVASHILGNVVQRLYYPQT